jgi:hypothetical protein
VETLNPHWMGENHMNRRWRKNKLLTPGKIGKWVKVNYYYNIISKNLIDNRTYILVSCIL